MNETEVRLRDTGATQAYGAALAALLRAGDLVVLSGDLGAGKTTLTQGIGAGLGIRGQVASPTFIIARVHPSVTGGPALVHVDAYRLGSLDELEALDLDASLDESVTVVEWGEGLVEGLAEDRLEIAIARPHGAGPAGDGAAPDGRPDDEPDDDGSSGTRTVTVRGVGPRWAGIVLPVVG
ncbi:MAG TPA: tRNA (adenosine(37)-N6)-threonylcarbamoyltransferase complex ATPase subunit type 1 TsaE [Cellulomonadaceae bacterium]|nr:tRNA (adenosine(37)-N6)-threonylcarbamoyltransferase complex ATPase subunit type 1 TsaE [Cellulomonadaceae bacterium]